MARIPTIKIPMFDTAFEVQIQMESPIYEGTVIAIYIKEKGTKENIKYPNATNPGEEQYHWDSLEASSNIEAKEEITFKIDGVALSNIAGVGKKYYGQVVLFDKDTKERKETVQPAKFKSVTELKE